MTLTDEEISLSFGQHLQECRKTRNLQLEAIAHELKIGESVLRAIEAENLSKLPPPVFAKGFLRGFARMVGADENRVIDGYLRRIDPSGKSSSRNIDNPFPGKDFPLVRMTLLAVVTLVLACLIFYGFSGQNESPIQNPVTNPSDTPAPAAEDEYADIPEGEDEQEEAVSLAPAEKAPEAIHLSVVTMAETWIKIIIDNGKTDEYLLRPGDNLELDAARGYNLLIGNAAGVKLFANTVPVDVPGGKGKVVNIQIP